MSTTPLVFRTTHRVQFSELDPYNHVGTSTYATYFINHRMEGLRERIGWGLEALGTLSFMTWVRRIEIDYIHPVQGDQEITIISFVREFRGPDAFIDCSMTDAAGTVVCKCVMTVAHVDKTSRHATDWPPDLIALFFEGGNRAQHQA